MGVPRLWEVLRPAGTPRSLLHLAVIDGFEANSNGKRGLRVGIDASIWFIHAQYGKEGENPELRTLFFRCCKLLSMPFLPLFVFDGPKRPKFKRGRWIDRKPNKLVQSLQNMINVFGFEWRTAPGEAEAELAYLNRIGVIDAVLTDDVDTFLFGAKTLIRNSSNTLSGNKQNPAKNAIGKDDGNYTMVYSSKAILEHPDIGLSQAGLVLIGVLSGGDYSSGLEGCGVALAVGLAKAGLGESLVSAVNTWPNKDDPRLSKFLETWRNDLREELKTNKSGCLPRKAPSLAARISITDPSFPDLDVLFSYTHPLTSASPNIKNLPISGIQWAREPDISGLARLCERHFEWGIRDIVLERFRTLLWGAMVGRVLRANVLRKDTREASGDGQVTPPSIRGTKPKPGTPSKLITTYFSTLSLSSRPPSSSSTCPSDSDPQESTEPEFGRLIKTIHSSRRHPTTGNLLEYRLEINPTVLTKLANAGIVGERVPISSGLTENEWETSDDDGGTGGAKKDKRKGSGEDKGDPARSMRVWIPAIMVRLGEPELVEEWEDKEAKKLAKKTPSGSRKRLPADPSSRSKGERKTRSRQVLGKSVETIVEAEGHDTWSNAEESDGELRSLVQPPLPVRSRKKPSTHSTLTSPPSRSGFAHPDNSTRNGGIRNMFRLTKELTLSSTPPKPKLRPTLQPQPRSLPIHVAQPSYKVKDLDAFIDLTTPESNSKIRRRAMSSESEQETEDAPASPTFKLKSAQEQIPGQARNAETTSQVSQIGRVNQNTSQPTLDSILEGLSSRTCSELTAPSSSVDRPTSSEHTRSQSPFPLDLDALFGSKRAPSTSPTSILITSTPTTAVITSGETTRVRPKILERRAREPVSVPSSPEAPTVLPSSAKREKHSLPEHPSSPKSSQRSSDERPLVISQDLSSSPPYGTRSRDCYGLEPMESQVDSKRKSKGQLWIDFSSEPEDNLVTPLDKMAPLMRARARTSAKPGGAGNMKGTPVDMRASPQKPNKTIPDDGIIDLCSD